MSRLVFIRDRCCRFVRYLSFVGLAKRFLAMEHASKCRFKKRLIKIFKICYHVRRSVGNLACSKRF